MRTLVFDTTALSHFARAGLLDLLQQLTADYECVMPNEVATEIQRGVNNYPALAGVFDLDWLAIVELDFPEVVYAATYKTELGGEPDQHLGEAAVLALARLRDGVGVIDDWAARETARHHGIKVGGTLNLICAAHKSGALDRAAAEHLVDELAKTDMRLPVDGSGLFAWAYQEGVFP